MRFLKPRLRVFFRLVILLAGLILNGCRPAEKLTIAMPEPVAIAPIFREFYAFMGGKERLGPAISELFQAGEKSYQFTEAALIVYDPKAPPGQNWSLAPLGLEMNVREPAVQNVDPQARWEDGHVIFRDFVAAYELLGGKKLVGKPLSEVHHNLEKKRYEQYFENLGFYRLEGDPPGTVHLLAYGAWVCDYICRSAPLESSLVLAHPDVAQIFSPWMGRWGADFFGFPLTDLRVEADGTAEQVFENLAMISEPDKGVRLVAVPQELGILPGPAVLPNFSIDFAFFPVQAPYGYNIPQQFLEYVKNHGGFALFGPPQGEVFLAGSQVYRQCFTYLCLDLDLSAASGLQARPAPLGYLYKNLHREEPAASPEKPASRDVVTLRVWEKHALISSAEQQEIGVLVLENQVPAANLQPVLELTLPDGTHPAASFPPTNTDGNAFMILPVLSYPNGTLIPYEVCLTAPSGTPVCAQDSFLIWNNP